MEAATGTQEAFASLKQARNEFNQRWAYLSQGNESIGLPAVPESLRDEVNAVEQDWNTLRRDTDAILASEQTVLSLHQVASTLAETIPQLQVEYEEVVDVTSVSPQTGPTHGNTVLDVHGRLFMNTSSLSCILVDYTGVFAPIASPAVFHSPTHLTCAAPTVADQAAGVMFSVEVANVKKISRCSRC